MTDDRALDLATRFRAELAAQGLVYRHRGRASWRGWERLFEGRWVVWREPLESALWTFLDVQGVRANIASVGRVRAVLARMMAVEGEKDGQQQQQRAHAAR